MNIIIELPNDLEQWLQSHLSKLSQRALEAVAVEAYRSQLISAAEVQQMLHLPPRLSTDAFLKQHEAYLPYTEAEMEQDLQAINRALSESWWLTITGLLGVLYRAGTQGLLDFYNVIDRLQQTSFWASPTLIQQLLEKYSNNVRRT